MYYWYTWRRIRTTTNCCDHQRICSCNKLWSGRMSAEESPAGWSWSEGWIWKWPNHVYWVGTAIRSILHCCWTVIIFEIPANTESFIFVSGKREFYDWQTAGVPYFNAGVRSDTAQTRGEPCLTSWHGVYIQHSKVVQVIKTCPHF